MLNSTYIVSRRWEHEATIGVRAEIYGMRMRF